MNTAIRLEAGELVYYRFRHTDGSGGKLRPVMIVSSLEFNQGEDVVGIPLTTQYRPGQRFAFELSDSLAWGLQHQSAAKWTKPFTLSKFLVIRRVGRIPPEVLSEIRGLIRTLFS